MSKQQLIQKLDIIFKLSEDQCSKGTAQSTNKPALGAVKGTAPHPKKNLKQKVKHIV